MLSKHRLQKGKNNNFKEGNVANMTITKVNTVSDVTWTSQSLQCAGQDGRFTTGIFFPNPMTSIELWAKHQTNPEQGMVGWVLYRITWPVFLKTVKVIKRKERWRNCHISEETVEPCNSEHGLGRGSGEGHCGETDKTQRSLECG